MLPTIVLDDSEPAETQRKDVTKPQ